MGIDKDKKQSAATELRRQAEKRQLVNEAARHPSRTNDETQRLVHELEVHQIELEMQNTELSQAREEVEASLDRYTDLYDFSPVGYVTLFRDGTVHSANLTFAGLMGIERSRMPGQRFGLFIADKDRLLFSDFLEKVFASQGKESCEVTLAKVESSPLFVQIEAIALGTGQHCHVAVIDITERKQAEAALHASEQRYRALMEFSPDAVIVIQDGRFVFANAVALRLHGLESPDEIIGLSVLDVIHPDDRELIRERIDRALQGESTHLNEARGMRKDGQPLIVEATGAPVAFNDRPAVQVILRDISERKRVQAALDDTARTVERERDILQAVMNGASNSHLVYLDRDFNFVRVNETYAQSCGYRPAQMIGKNHFALYPDAENEAIFARVLDTGEPVAYHDKPFEFPDQPERGVTYWDWTLFPVKDPDGQVVGLVFSLFETTERKRAEEILRFLGQCGTAETGEGFFPELARYLAQALNMEFICIDRLEEDNLTAQTLAVFHDGQFEDNVSYTLLDTPCGDVVGQSICRFPQNVQGLFPRDSVLQELQAESYLGVTLWSTHGEPIGLIAAIGRHPLADTRQAESILHLVAVRAAAELERQQAEEALKRSAVVLQASEQRMQQALQVSRSFTFEWQPVTDQVLRSTSCATILRLSGDSVCLDRGENYFMRVHPDDRECFVQMLRNLKPDADTYTTEYRVVRDDGSIVELEETGQALFDTAGKLQQLVGVTTDITARKQAEEALHNSEKMYRAIGESIDYGVWVCAPDGRNIYASDSFLKLVGLTQEQCSDFGWGEVLHPEDAERTISAWQECVRTGGNWDIEHRFRGVDGQWHPILARGVPVKNEDGIVLCWAGINLNIRRRKQAETELQKAHDELELRVRKRTEELVQTVDTLQTEIIEREQAERSLQRLNRLYDVLSETNQAIVRASERDSLFRDICRIAVDHGGFLLSWVGLVEETSGLVHISAAHGVTAYLEDIRILVNQEPAGSGPTGIALREGTHFICNDFQNDPCTGPWQERVQAHGIQASAAIALKQEGQVIGAFTVYAGEQDFFDQQHEGLLQQMGVDISFALDNFVKEAHHQEAEQALLQATTERLKTLEDLREKDHLLLQQGRLAAMGEMIGNIAHQWRQPLNTLGLTIQDLALSWELGEFCEELLQARVAKAMQVISHMSRTIDDFRNFFRPDKQKEPFKVSRIVGNALSLIGGSYKNLQIRVEVDTGTDPTITGYPNEFAQVLLNILSNARDALVATAAVEPAITIVLWETAGRTVVTIRDNAGGIPEEILDKIFDPYFSTKGPEQGTGLGLFMAKTIIETNMGGTLTVRNVGDGAEFRIEV